MQEVRLIMGMPIEVELVGEGEEMRDALEEVFAYFMSVDEQFSPYKKESEISRINRSELLRETASGPMQEVLARAEKASADTNGYFDIRRADGLLDPSGIVKGWAIRKAAARLRAAGFEHFSINAGGDIASSGMNAQGGDWSVGIENPFNRAEIVKVVYPRGKGMATSGSYIRGAHIYNPHEPEETLDDVVSLTVIGPDVEQADVFATAAFAMGRAGIAFIEAREGSEGYMIDRDGIATMTSGFPLHTKA